MGGGSSSLSTRELLLASTVSKVAATLGTYPYQVIRSNMQQRLTAGADSAKFYSTWSTAAHIWRADRLRGFYRGILAHVLRSTPQASITLLVYERVQRLLTS